MEGIDYRGQREDLTFRQGQTLGPYTFTFEDEDGLPVAITAARMTVRLGTLASPGAVVEDIDVDIGISTDGQEAVWELTPTQTRLLTPDTNYCYEFEVDTEDETTESVLEGQLYVYKEIAS